MTSVRSHLLPLSGSRKYISIISCVIIFFLVSSCEALRKTPDKRDVEVIEDRPPVKIDTVTVKPPVPPVDKKYNVALILPFKLDPAVESSEDFENDEDGSDEGGIRTPSLTRETLLAVEFYEGVKMAVKELRMQGLNMDLYVYDCRNSVSQVRSIFKRPEMAQMNLIIGPIYNETQRVAAELAKQKNLTLVNPLSPSVNIDSYENYIVMNPTLQGHMKGIHRFLNENHRNSNRIILHSNKQNDISLANFLVKTGHFENPKKNYHSVRATLNEIGRVKLYLQPDKTNIVIIPSFDEGFITNATRILHSFSGSHNIIVFGMPTWLNYGSLRLDHMNNMQLHISQSYYPDVQSPVYKNFTKAYLDEYNSTPTDNTINGFDVMMYYGNALNRFGLSFMENFDKITYEGINTTYNIRSAAEYYPSVDSTNNYYENTRVHIIKYDNYQLRKVN